MSVTVRITPTVAKVLRPFLEEPTTPRYGFDLMEAAGVSSGTLYPILARLEQAGWLKRQSGGIQPAAAGKPPRKFYLITPEGVTLARRALTALSAEVSPPAARLLRPEGGAA